MSIIAMMTDFGIKDGNVGVMKGVIHGICPEAGIVDLSHMIQPQNIPEAALVLARSAPFFPPKSIFLVVVDPGVGTDRRPLAARVGSHFFVGPDNGILTMWLEQALTDGATAEFVALDRREYWLPRISNVFHGRDIFAPVAAHLAAGVQLSQIGAAVSDPVRLRFPQPHREGGSLVGEIIHIDHFGNLASNIYADQLSQMLGRQERIFVNVGLRRIEGIVKTFGDRRPGELVALIGSTGNLIVAEVNGNAAAALGTKVGDRLQVVLPVADVEDSKGSNR